MISNRCDEGCPHCLQDSREDGGLMSLETFCEAIELAAQMDCHMILITGGEPTENPQMEAMLQRLDQIGRRAKMGFTILTNGTWIEDDEKRRMMWRISRMKTYLGMQVYTNRKWYQDYDFIEDWKTELEQIPGCKVDDTSPIFMQDLGRARNNAEAQQEVERNPYRCSCLTVALAARQIRDPFDFIPTLEQQGKFCKPLIDMDGNIHMSESRLCPSVGNVCEDSMSEIYRRMREFRPCMRCKNSRNLFKDDDPRMPQVRAILGIPDNHIKED